MKSTIVIPARLASTRLPRKLLLDETGKTVLEHTYAACKSSKLATEVVVAADDAEIESAVLAFGGQVQMTDVNHRCGTDRVAEVAKGLDSEIVVNVQGDEPEIDAASIDQVIQLLVNQPDAMVATLATPIRDRSQLEDPSCVKVVFDALGQAMYFSRSVIPHPREWSDELLERESPVFWQHVGIYGYRRRYLLEISSRPAVEIEKIESLEQLRILDAADSILVGKTEHRAMGIDTPEDYRSFVSRQAN